MVNASSGTFEIVCREESGRKLTLRWPCPDARLREFDVSEPMALVRVQLDDKNRVLDVKPS